MKFKTDIEIPHAPFEITHGTCGIFIGSCFTTNIGEKLEKRKFPVLINPTGTVYNPVSITNTIELLLGDISFNERDIFNDNDIWQSYWLHTSFSSIHKEDVMKRFQTTKQNFSTLLPHLDYIFITLGTAWVYILKENGMIVNNCHKSPASYFKRRRLGVEECVNTLQKLIFLIREQRPKTKFIFTVSPIRHWKDGAHENQISKATLLLCIEELQKNNRDILYFPAYEILMDELRDYRFYDNDMLHPNTSAIQYIWETFQKTYFTQETCAVTKKIEDIHKAIEHKPFNENSPQYIQFIEQQILACLHIESQHPEISLQMERDLLIQKQKHRKKGL